MDERNSCDLSFKKDAFRKFCIHSDVKVLILVYELMHQTKENLVHKLQNAVRLEIRMFG